jgi:hypothetical protein
MYIEASDPRKAGERARMHTEILPTSTTPNCLSFWYHMSGSGMGTLTIYKESARDNSLSRMWELSGDQGNTWKQVCINDNDYHSD